MNALDQLQLVREFERLATYNISNSFDKGMKLYAERLLRLPPLKGETPDIKEVRLALSNTKTEKERACKCLPTIRQQPPYIFAEVAI